MEIRQGTFAIEGADLYYETRGEGPPVLIIQGGVGEAGATDQLAESLAEHYQVISYDRRGLSRSTVSSEAPPTEMSRHATDAAALLAAVSTRPARVIGPSIGALIGLYLAVQHPERVALLVAHEPPMTSVVFDPQREAALDTIAALARTDVKTAIRRMASLTDSSDASREDGARSTPPVGNLDTNLRRFFTYDFPAVRNSALSARDIAVLPQSTAIVLTGGVESRGQWEYRCAERLADELDRKLIELPGGHNGLVSHPWSTAVTLQRLFMEAETP